MVWEREGGPLILIDLPSVSHVHPSSLYLDPDPDRHSHHVLELLLVLLTVYSIHPPLSLALFPSPSIQTEVITIAIIVLPRSASPVVI